MDDIYVSPCTLKVNRISQCSIAHELDIFQRDSYWSLLRMYYFKYISISILTFISWLHVKTKKDIKFGIR